MLLADGRIQPNNYLEEFHHHKRFILCMFHHPHLHPPPPQHHKITVLLFSFFSVSLIELANQEYLPIFPHFNIFFFWLLLPLCYCTGGGGFMSMLSSVNHAAFGVCMCVCVDHLRQHMREREKEKTREMQVKGMR